MKNGAFVIGAITLLSANVVCAQEEAKACTALLDHGISNVIRYTTEQQYLSVLKDEYCKSSFSSLSKTKQSSFSAAFEDFSGSFGGGKTQASEQHENFCRNYQSLNTGSGRTDYDARTLYDKAIDAWRDCINLAIGGIQIKPSVSPTDRFVDFTLSLSRGEGKFTGVDASNMVCKLGGNVLGPSESIILGAAAQSIRCERTAAAIQFQGSTVEFFPPANVKVKTNTGDYRVDFFEMIDEPAKSRFERLEAQIAKLQEAQAVTSATIDSLATKRDGTAYAVANPFMVARYGKQGMAECPPGTYVSMIYASLGVGGTKAVDGISEITFKCAPVK